MKPALQIDTHSVLTSSKSFFGGVPLVPPEFQWPIWDTTPYFLDELKDIEKNYERDPEYFEEELVRIERKLQNPLVPLTFLAQIDLQEIPRYSDFPVLPKTGIVYFFWESFLVNPLYLRPSEKGSFRVIYTDNKSTLRTDFFLFDIAEIFEQKFDRDYHMEWMDICGSISFQPVWSLSNEFEKSLVRNYDYDKPIQELINSLLKNPETEELPNGFPEKSASNILIDGISKEPYHHLFGDAMEIQNPMEETCQLCFHDFDTRKFQSCKDPQTAYLEAGTQDWQLLLQLDSDDLLDWCWGDRGRVYFWI